MTNPSIFLFSNIGPGDRFSSERAGLLSLPELSVDTAAEEIAKMSADEEVAKAARKAAEEAARGVEEEAAGTAAEEVVKKTAEEEDAGAAREAPAPFATAVGDTFSSERKGSLIGLSASNTRASLKKGPSRWAFVKDCTAFGNRKVCSGTFDWHLHIDQAANPFVIMIGVADVSRSTKPFGYIMHEKCTPKFAHDLYVALSEWEGQAWHAHADVGRCAAGDTVTVSLDMATRQLSFRQNGADLSVFHKVLAVYLEGWSDRAPQVTIVDASAQL